MEGTIYLGDIKKDMPQEEPEDKNPVVEAKNTPSEDSYKPVSTVQGSLSKPIRAYIEKFRNALKKEKEKASTPIVVDELASRIAKFYEKIRRVIDWKEEHLMRRSVIERILKRRLISEISGAGLLPDVDPKKIAEPLVLELVRSGYFENGTIPKERIIDVQKILEKYVYILRNGPIKNGNGSYSSKKKKSAGVKKRVNFYNWILEVASCEIEEVLDPALRENALIELMTDCLVDRVKLIPEGKLSEEEAYVQTYIAVHQTIFNLDEPLVAYHVLKHKHPEFIENDSEKYPHFAENSEKIWSEIVSDLDHVNAPDFYRVAEKFDAPYLILGDVFNKLEETPEEIEDKLMDAPLLDGFVDDAYGKRLETLKSRLFRSAIFSTLSIFVAGGVSLFIFEVPIANWIHGSWSPWALVADILIPTALMFLLVWAIKPPDDSNLEKIKEEVEKIIKHNEKQDIYEVKVVKKVRKILNFIFIAIYLAGGFGALYLTYWVFSLAHVPWTSLYIDTANVAVVVFAAMVIRQKAKELTVEEKSNFIEFIVDFFSIPLAKIGLWLSTKWKEYNIVSVFFATLIDIPFSGLVETIEGWRDFLKEKRTDIH
ncbi:hypothetical protein ACFLZ4_02640 [Patescibacteria group bacterium]